MPFLLAEILNFQGSTHRIGVGSFSKNLFPTESAIKDSAIYKASPLHKLTKEQEEARELIIQKVSEALEKEETK